ncbi:uncharacterized protein [Gossypium hirsutum]|uniref:Retrotransposon gag protein n=1 Tax=Gossypium hirsutum TaxID=3635 RepID=A0ABM3A181_GOSHI|nr:uncharacterized protein LOC107902448 [Gossypium hirsutum]
MEMNMVNAASGGALVNMTPQQARDLISTMAANSQQFRANTEPSRRVHQLSNSTLEDKVDRFTNMMNSFIAEKAKTARLCGICATPDHATDACPSLYVEITAHLDAVGNFLGPPQTQYDPYANTYNPGWRDHPKLSYGANLRNNQPYQNWFPQQPQGSEMKDFQQKTEASIRELATSIEKLNSQGKLPSQTEPKPRQNANAVTLRSGKCRRGKEDKEILETFRNVEINIPLLDAIKQIPRYAKFLKDLCTNKRKLTGNERVNVGENVSAVLQRKMPAKCVIIQLADRSVEHPEGVLEDVLVKVNELIFLADFYVIKMEEDSTPGSSDLLLGRPFLSTASTKIDVRSGTLTMDFDGEIVKFNVYDAISHPSEILSAPELELEPPGKARKSDIQELEEIRNDAYENAHIYKDKTKLFHDKRIAQKHFSIGQKVLLHNSVLNLFPGKLRSRWQEPFIVTKVFTYGVVEIESEESGKRL